ncbi:MAG: hypothetical protein JO029_06505 [Candidatus Eremiobacteraeota bacterium]|nr:hypothetical protein [Candidatus Eremiobacteraeota bacterium]
MGRRRSLVCGKCGGEKNILGNGAARCSSCHNRWLREYYRKSETRRENQRRAYVQRKYGISLDELADLLMQQNGCCAICGRRWQDCISAKRAQYDVRFLQYLCVDHDHVTRKVRGLLCNGCNTAIGMFGEDPARFAAAASYLARSAS